MNIRNTSPIPFIYGRPVRAGEFVNREAELRTIFNRLRNGESTAVVGEPHIGKSSVLMNVADSSIQRAYLGTEAQRVVVSPVDLQPVGNDYTPFGFWEEALEPLQKIDDADLKQHLVNIARAQDVRHPLSRLFNYLSEQGRRLILVLDEFERLLIHPNFRDASFFALLRSLATRTGGLALVTASRLSVEQMNERGRGLLETGSPFFNNMIEVRLRPFDERSIDLLLDRGRDVLSLYNRRFIRRVAGRHPFLLQAMAATLIETTGDDHQARGATTFYERVSSHFDDLWHTLDDRTRTTAVILSLMELGGRALGKDFAYGEIERVDVFGPELKKLAESGLAEQADKGWQFDWENLLFWQGARWTIGAQAFTWWVRDRVIGESRKVLAFEEWLENQQYRFLLTQRQWDDLTSKIRGLPEWAVRGVAGLARALFEELTRQK